MYAGRYFDLIEGLFHHFRAGIKSSFVFCGPPVDHVAVLVELATLVIETVGHLMTDDDSDSTIVEGIVGTHVKERILEYTGGETDLVAGRVIVCVHGLRRHVPFGLIHRFAEITHAVVLLELSGTLQVCIVGVFRVYFQLRIVAPIVGITDLDGHRVQFFQSLVFRLTTHPCEVLDTDTQCLLQVLNER